MPQSITRIAYGYRPWFARATLIGMMVWSTIGCNRIRPVEPIVRTATAAAGTSSPIALGAADWPWWGGPRKDRTSDPHDIPTEWSATENVVWSVPVPGRGHSSPAVCQERIFVTTADESAQKQLLLCFDCDSGKLLWERVLHENSLMKLHSKNSHASATPACDGERVFAVMMNGGSIQVTATDLDGQPLWMTAAGDYGSEHGYGSSPVIHEDLIIILADNLTGSFIAALDRAKGDIVWRTARPTTGRHGSYATPITVDVAGRTQLVVAGMNQVTSYDPASGTLLWSCAGPSEVAACTVAARGDVVIASGGYPEKEILAIRADGSADVTDTHVVWRAERGVTYVPSPLIHDEKVFIVDDAGVATCFQLADGKQLAQKRLGGSFSASPILVGDQLYVTNEAGVTFVVKADTSLEIVAKNDLADGGFATPVVSGDRLILRTGQRLYCIGHSASAQ